MKDAKGRPHRLMCWCGVNTNGCSIHSFRRCTAMGDFDEEIPFVTSENDAATYQTTIFT